MIIIPQLRLGYQQVPKVASTSMFDLLYACCAPTRKPAASAKPDPNAKRRYFKAGRAGIKIIDNEPAAAAPFADFLMIALTRDPVRRFLSMYANRVVHHNELSAKSKHAPDIERSGLRFTPGINELIAELDAYFAAAPTIRHHGRPIMDFLGPDLSVYDRIVDISGSGALVQEVRAHWRSHGLHEIEQRCPELGRRQTGGPKLGLGVLSEASFERLMTFYAEDYARIPTVSATGTRSAYALERQELLEAEAQRRARQKQKAAAAAQARIRRSVLHVELDKSTWKGALGGAAVLAHQAPEGMKLQALIGESTLPVEWNCPSPRIQLRYPQAPNGAHARFRIAAVPAGGGELRLVLRDPSTDEAGVIATTVVAPDGPRLAVADARQRIKDLADNPERSEADRKQLRSILNAVPAQARRVEWQETMALANALFQREPESTFMRVQAIHEAHRKRGTPAEFDAFWRELAAILAPLTITPHGYRPALAGRDEAAVWRGVERIIATLGELGYRGFINSGTLLGAIRDGRLIAHDDDVDLAVILDSDSPAALAREWVELKRRLAVAGLLDTHFERERKSHCKLHRIAGVSVDLFPAWIADDRVFVWPHTFGEVPSSALLPLRALEIGGAAVAAPRLPEPLLVTNYGPGWMTPDPSFRFDWSTALKRFGEFIAELKLARQSA